MATLTNYKGLQVLDGTPFGAGGEAINTDFRSLVDWNPKSEWNGSAYPTSTNDESQDFQRGSFWFSESNQSLFRCEADNQGSAMWRGVPMGPRGTTVMTTTVEGFGEEMLLSDDSLPTWPDNSTVAYEILAVARRTDSGNDSAVWKINGAFKSSNGTIAEIDSHTETVWADPGAGSWQFTFFFRSFVQYFFIEVFGQAGATVDWTANVQFRVLEVEAASSISSLSDDTTLDDNKSLSDN